MNNGESIKHKIDIHIEFPLDPKTGTIRLIFDDIPFNVTIHIYLLKHLLSLAIGMYLLLIVVFFLLSYPFCAMI